MTPELAKSFRLAKPEGALVANVERTLRGKAGIKRGDVIVKFNNKVVHERTNYRAGGRTPIKKTVDVKVIRGTNRRYRNDRRARTRSWPARGESAGADGVCRSARLP